MDVIYLVKYGLDPTDESTMPLIAKLNRHLADLYSSRSFKNWFAKVSVMAPWITHTLLTQVHLLYSMMAGIANNPTNKRTLKRGLAIDPNTYTKVVLEFKRIQDNSASSLGSLFTSAPSSYQAKKATRDNINSNNKRKADHKVPHADRAKQQQSPANNNRGWIMNTSGKHVHIPGVHFCSSFACDDSMCCYNACTRGHNNFPRDFTKPEQGIVCNHVKATQGLQFANHISLPHFMTGAGIGGNPSRVPQPRAATPAKPSNPAANDAASPAANKVVTPAATPTKGVGQ
eukprot:scaffold18140_cov28-Attheya_sp.AAC.3